MDYLVAPYEADAQFAYLEHGGLVDAMITEDPDLPRLWLDAVASTVVSISRKDYGSLT